MKIYVFSVHEIFKTRCLPFVIEFQISESRLYLRSMCSVHCLRKPKRTLRFPEFGSREHISDIKLFASKILIMSFNVVRFHTVTLFSFDFSLNFLKFTLDAHYITCYYLCA